MVAKEVNMKGWNTSLSMTYKVGRLFVKFPQIQKWFSLFKSVRRILSLMLLMLLATSCGNSSSPPPVSNDYTVLSNPELVTINGYSNDVMEPFISRDGNYLFFNNNAVNSPQKDIFYATRVTDTVFQYQGPITAINSVAVDGVPTTDNTNKFYYVSLVSYNGSTNLNTLYSGVWSGNTVTSVTPLSTLTLSSPLLFFDIEVNPGGSTLYLSVGAFTGGSSPSAADIVVAVNPGSGFTLDPNSTSIMANVNTADKLEYAPAISANGLEIFFTRYDPSTGVARIYRAVRTNTSSAFGVPQLVSAITGFVEGPAFSPDEKSLYYHRLNSNTNLFEIYRVTRP
jgi:hypothetical protein